MNKNKAFKGIVHQKIKILSHYLLTIMSFQTCKTFVHLRNTFKIFWMKSKIFLILHRQQHNYHVQGPER